MQFVEQKYTFFVQKNKQGTKKINFKVQNFFVGYKIRPILKTKYLQHFMLFMLKIRKQKSD